MNRRGLVVAALALLVVIGGSPGVVDATTGGTASAVTGPPAVATDVITDSSTPVVHTYRRLPEHPNEMEVTVRVPDTSELGEIEVDLQSGMAATATDGFERENGVYVWDGTTASPTVTYRMKVANSLGRAVFEGGIVTTAIKPFVTLRGADCCSVDAVHRLSVDGPGTTTDNAVVLGNYTEFDRTVDGQRLRLIVPDGVDPARPRLTTMGILVNASRSLDVDGPESTAHGILVPGGGGKRTDRTFFVGRGEPAEEILHGYAEVQRDFTYLHDGQGEWAYNGLPFYFGLHLALESGVAGPSDFRAEVAEGRMRAELADLDRRIRLESGGKHTLEDVFRRLNGHQVVGASKFADAVRAVSNDSIGDRAGAYARGEREPPEAWEPGAYERAFGYEPANVTIDTGSLAARGPDWNRTLSGPAPISLGRNETLVIQRAVENDGTIAGLFAARQAFVADHLDDPIRRPAHGWVGAESRRNVTVTHRFDRTGEYVLLRGFNQTRIRVLPLQNTARVATIDVPTRVEDGEAIRITATVTNEEETLARTTIPVRVDGTVHARRTLTLGPGENGTINATVQPTDAGAHNVSVGTRATTVAVGSTANEEGDTDGGPEDRADGTGDTTASSGPGFGPIVAIFGLLAGLTILGRRGRQRGR